MQDVSVKQNPAQKKYSLIYRALLLIGLGVAFIFPHFSNNYNISFYSMIFLQAIIAIGYNIVSGYAGMTNFASAALYGASAYASAILISRYHMPFFVGMLGAIAAATVVGMVISLSASKVKGLYLTLVSMGVLEVVQRILIEWSTMTGGAAGFPVPPATKMKWEILPGIILKQRMHTYYVIFAFLIIAIIIQRNVIKSQWGRSFISIANNELAAAGVGVPFRQYRVVAFFLNALLAGIAGSIYSSYQGYISPDTFNFNFTVFILLSVIVGGSGTLSGPVVGVFIATIIPDLFKSSADLKQIAYGLLLIILSQVLPGGIVGLIKRRCHEIDDNTYIVGETPSSEIDIHIDNTGKSENILEVTNLTRRFGGLTAVDSLNMTVKRGSIHSLIGPNGAGKTTTVNMITCIDGASEGDVIFNGESIIGTPVEKLVLKGVSRTYQHVRLFSKLSVLENVAMGTRLHHRYSLASAIFRTPTMRKKEKQSFKDALDYLGLIDLADKANIEPDSLSSGQQKLLELARALCMKPEFLVLDEPCAGLTETETAEFAELIKRIRDSGITVLLIEHHMSLVMDISDYITVLEYGKKISEGTPAQVSADPEVRRAYLGEGEWNNVT